MAVTLVLQWRAALLPMLTWHWSSPRHRQQQHDGLRDRREGGQEGGDGVPHRVVPGNAIQPVLGVWSDLKHRALGPCRPGQESQNDGKRLYELVKYRAGFVLIAELYAAIGIRRGSQLKAVRLALLIVGGRKFVGVLIAGRTGQAVGMGEADAAV